MIHIVFGAAATGSLKHAFRKQDHKIIGFPIDFSIRPITNIHTKNGIKNYFTWLRSTFHTVWGYFENDETAFQQSLQRLMEIEDGEQVTIWTSENASEQIGLRFCCYLLKDKQVRLSFVNSFEAMMEYTKNKDVKVEILHTGECSPEQLAHFFKAFLCPVSEEMRSALEQDGEDLLQSTAIVRSFRQREIINELETRDDSFIMDCIKRIHDQSRYQKYINTILVIGEVLAYSKQITSDAWIEYRIRSLIDGGQLDYEGNLQSKRMYKIKIVE